MRYVRILIVGTTILAPLAATAAPLLQYSFNEPNGQTIDTGTGTPANGTLMNAAVRSSDTPSGTGSSVNFNVTEPPAAHVLSSDADKLDGLDKLTLTTWLKVSSYPSGNHRLVAKQNAGTFGGFSWNMNATPNDGPVGPDNFRVGLFVGNDVSSGPSDFASGFSTADADAGDKWAFLAVTYDSALSSNNTRFYIGGVNTPVTQLGNPLTLAQLTVDGGAAAFGVGYTHAAPTADTSVRGLQDDVRVYGEALDLASLDAVRLTNVPEPTSVAMLALGSLALIARRQRHASFPGRG